MRKTLSSEAAPSPIAPYVQGIDCGEYVYVSGQLGIDVETGAIPEDAAEETAVVLRNVRAVLAEAGLDMDSVVKTTVYMTDPDDYAAMNQAYGAAFGESPPARATVGAAWLLAGARVEIEAVAKRA